MGFELRAGAGAVWKPAGSRHRCQGVLYAFREWSVGVKNCLGAGDGLEVGLDFKVESKVTVVCGVSGIGFEVETATGGFVRAGALENHSGLAEVAGYFDDAIDLVAAGESAAVKENVARGGFVELETHGLEHHFHNEVVLHGRVFDAFGE